jgi:hypothetical protein
VGAGGGGGGASSSGGSGGGGGASSSSAGAGGSAEPGSDMFDGSSLDPSWQVLNPGAVSITVSGGSLSLELTQAALWYQASQGVLVFKEVTGNFKATARVHAHRTTNPAEPPITAVELGGLMARSPAGPPENYVFIVVGRDENDISVETKTTVNSQSTYLGPTWPSAEAELRVCRVGSDFLLLKRPVAGGAWIAAASYARPDLPATLAVGPNIYSLNQPDLTVRFDEVVFAEVSDAAGCSAD